VARALFNVNAHCGTVFSSLDEKDLHSVGQHCPVRPLKVTFVRPSNPSVDANSLSYFCF
jgi:hypothetical protein